MDPKLSKLIRRVQAAVPHEDDVKNAMDRQLARIKFRTLAGRDVNGFPFLRKRDGSPSYLNRTGTLLRSLQADATRTEQGLEGRVSVTGRAREYAPMVNAKRRFLGASPDDRAGVISDLKQSMNDRRTDA